MSSSTVEAALNGDLEKKFTLIAKVFGKTDIEKYENKEQKSRTFFIATVADSTAVCKIRMYKNSNDVIDIGETYRFKDIIRKPGGFWFINFSTFAIYEESEIPENVIQEARYETEEAKDKAEPKTPRKLKEAVASPTTSCVKGKVIQVSPLKRVRDGALPIKFLALKDSHDCPPVKIALFNKDAETTYSKGDCVAITDVYRYKNSNGLSTRTTAKIEFIDPTSVEVDIEQLEDSDMLDDEDFEKEPEIKHFKVVGIDRTNIYDCCGKLGCKKKKLVEKRCPYCKESTDKRSKYGYAKVIIKTLADNEENDFTLFYDDLKKIADLPPVEQMNNDKDLMFELSKQLRKGIHGQGIFENGKVSIVQ